MSVPAEVSRHLSRRYEDLTTTFLDWRQVAAGPAQAGAEAADLGEVVEGYLRSANIGDVGRIGSGTVVSVRERAPKGAPSVLVIGSHDVSGLATKRSQGTEPDVAAFRGPGVASLLGPVAAFVEGFRTTILDVIDEPLNLAVASLDPADSAAEIHAELDLDGIDAILLARAVNWAPEAPTLTVGTRGRIEAEISIAAPSPVYDAAYAGAARNPLNRLVEMLAALRDSSGRIALEGFYDRAEPPTRGGFGPTVDLDDAWQDSLALAAPGGKLDPLERAALWPVVSVLDVSADEAPAGVMPAKASARLALHLVPDQRPAEVERSLRAWVDRRLPDNLTGHTRIVATARPYRLGADEPVVAAQIRAIRRVSGTSPVLVGAGGPAGTGELHYRTGVPVAFTGIAGPAQGWGTTREHLPHSLFDLAVATAAETCVQLRRRSSVRSTP